MCNPSNDAQFIGKYRQRGGQIFETLRHWSGGLSPLNMTSTGATAASYFGKAAFKLAKGDAVMKRTVHGCMLIR
jgi:hypothetical protein